MTIFPSMIGYSPTQPGARVRRMRAPDSRIDPYNMKKLPCSVLLILLFRNSAYAQWRCDDWGTWMMEWGISFWIQPITLVFFLFTMIAVAVYVIVKITRSA